MTRLTQFFSTVPTLHFADNAVHAMMRNISFCVMTAMMVTIFIASHPGLKPYPKVHVSVSTTRENAAPETQFLHNHFATRGGSESNTIPYCDIMRHDQHSSILDCDFMKI